MGDVLTISGACKRFGVTRALDGADLALGRGEWLGLLGPNGAGKTTLVRSVTACCSVTRSSDHAASRW